MTQSTDPREQLVVLGQELLNTLYKRHTIMESKRHLLDMAKLHEEDHSAFHRKFEEDGPSMILEVVTLMADVAELDELINIRLAKYSSTRSTIEAMENLIGQNDPMRDFGEEKLTPDAWSRRLNVQVVDPDGWDRTNFTVDWAIPLTQEEFTRKMNVSTCRPYYWAD